MRSITSCSNPDVVNVHLVLSERALRYCNIKSLGSAVKTIWFITVMGGCLFINWKLNSGVHRLAFPVSVALQILLSPSMCVIVVTQ